MCSCIPKFGRIFDTAQRALSTTPALILDVTTIGGDTNMSALQLCNNGSTETIYIGHDNSVGSGKYMWALSPGDPLEILGGPGYLDALYAVASSGTPNLYVAVVG